MIAGRFAVVLGVAIFLFAAVAALYVVWVRMVGLDPSVAKAYAVLSRPRKTALAMFLGAFVGTAIEATASVEAGVAVAVLLATSTFLGLLAFELVNHRARAAGAADR